MAPFTQLELRAMWIYSDGARTVRAYRAADGAARAGNWVLVDPESGNVEGTAAAGEFSGRFRPVDVFADVTGFPTYLGTVVATDGAALVDLLLDRDPFMLANGPRREARPHVLIVPRRHRDGWSSATAQELMARHTAMTLVAAWYRSLDGGHVLFSANDSPANLDYLRDVAAASGSQAEGGIDNGTDEADGGTDDGTLETVTRNPRQEVQHAHLHAFYTEQAETENHESSAVQGRRVMATGERAYGDSLGGDAVRVEDDSSRLAADVRRAARPWGGGYCSYQRGVAGPLWVAPALGPSMDEFNRRLAAADGLRAEPDPRLGGAINLVRPGLGDAGRRDAARRATAEQRAGFQDFVARRGLNARSLTESLARGVGG